MTVRELVAGMDFGKPRTYDISFINADGEEDETEFDAVGSVDELEQLFSDFCKENQFPDDTVFSVEYGPGEDEEVESSETYDQMSARHQKEINEFPLRAAFSRQQFAEMMSEWGLKEKDTGKILSIGAGCYIKKDDEPAFTEMIVRHRRERVRAIKADKTGEGFIYQMFYRELCNHEYGYTQDATETLETVGVTDKDLKNNPALNAGLKKAMGRFA